MSTPAPLSYHLTLLLMPVALLLPVALGGVALLPVSVLMALGFLAVSLRTHDSH